MSDSQIIIFLLLIIIALLAGLTTFDITFLTFAVIAVIVILWLAKWTFTLGVLFAMSYPQAAILIGTLFLFIWQYRDWKKFFKQMKEEPEKQPRIGTVRYVLGNIFFLSGAAFFVWVAFLPPFSVYSLISLLWAIGFLPLFVMIYYRWRYTQETAKRR